MKNNNLILFFIVLFLISGCSSATIQQSEEKFHIHADFKVYVNDKAIDFSVLMYQLRDRSVHVENGIGDVMHVHKKGITMGNFLDTLGVEFNQNCIKIPVEGSYCNDDNKKLRFFVNGLENAEFENYEIKNLDKILVSYGEGDVDEQLESVTNLASGQ